ncbi:MAG: hypothetical protein N3G20_08170, partial [Verrucomicrobiae bacterium]|nr:hypothetical protein [Verrucomicrobiae bacterium]
RKDRPTTIADYQRRIAGQKTVLERVRQMPDQTLENAMAKTHRQSQNEGPVMLSLACDNAKVIVERNGDIRWQTLPGNTTDWAHRAAAVRVRLENAPQVKRTRKLHGGWLPSPVITTIGGPIWLTQRTFVAPVDKVEGNPFRLNRPSVCVVELGLTNTSSDPVIASLRLTFFANVESNQFAMARRHHGDNKITIEHDNALLALLRWDLDQLNSWITTHDGDVVVQGELIPGAGFGITALLALAGQSVPDTANTADLFDEFSRYWNCAIQSAMQIEVPDPLLNDLIRSSRVRCLIDARNEAEGERVAAWIAAMSYGPLESEAHSVIRGMDFMGHSDFARRSLDYFIRRYNTNGFLTTGYTTFGTGWHLWTVGEHWRLTRDTNWLRANLNELVRVGHWVLRQTDKTRRFTESGKPVRGFGLMPPGVLADWNAFAQHFCMSAYYSAGLRELGLAAAALGHPDAQLFKSAGDELARATLRAFEANAAEAPVVALRNGTWVPFYPAQAHTPGMVGRSFPGEDAGRSWAYNVELGAHQMVPAGVLSPHAPLTTLMLEHMEDVYFLQSGWFDYPAADNERDWFNLGGFAKVQPFYCRNAEIYAMRDEAKPFLRTYFNSVASLLNEEVLTFWEHFNHSGAWDKTHETGYFLYQTRIMLVQERGEDLWLAPLVPARWLCHGRQIEVRNAPTFFGAVSYSILSHSAGEFIEARVIPPDCKPPRYVVIRFRHPDSKPVREVRLVGEKRSVELVDESTVRVKPHGKPFTILARF